MNNGAKNQKRRENEPARKKTVQYVCRLRRGIHCKGKLAQSQQVPQRSKPSTKEIDSLEAELKQAEREITDLKEKIGYSKSISQFLHWMKIF